MELLVVAACPVLVHQASINKDAFMHLWCSVTSACFGLYSDVKDVKLSGCKWSRVRPEETGGCILVWTISMSMGNEMLVIKDKPNKREMDCWEINARRMDDQTARY